MPDWKNPDVMKRLIASIIASTGGSVDNMNIARFFDTSYDAIENQLRPYKKLAAELVKEAQAAGRLDQNMRKKSGSGGAFTAAATAATKNRASASVTKTSRVTGGRVGKTTAKKAPKGKKKAVSDDDQEEEGDGDGDDETEEEALAGLIGIKEEEEI